MAISLRLATGEIRTYRTSYPGWGENPSYHTECGKIWPDCPEQKEECDHLDCALRAAEKRKHQSLLFLGGCVIASFWARTRMMELISEGGWAILLLAFSILIFIFAIYILYHERKEMNELNEYKNRGTVRGIKALKIGPNS